MVRNLDHVVVIGCGGIGSWLLAPLLRFLHAERFEGVIHLWDGDRYSTRNVARQEFEREQVGINKAEAQAGIFSSRFPGMRLHIHGSYVVPENVQEAVLERSMILVAVDNHPARALIARCVAGLRDVCVLSAGNEALDGNVHTTLRRGGKDLTQPLLARHPEIAERSRGDRAEAGCEERIVLGETQLLVTNFLAAASLFTAFHLVWHYGERRGRRKYGVPQEIYFDAGACAMSMLPPQV